MFTINLLDRGSDLLVQRIEALREALPSVRARAPFHIDARAMLPEHLHCIWPLPPDGTDHSSRWHAVEARFSAAMPRKTGRLRVHEVTQRAMPTLHAAA